MSKISKNVHEVTRDPDLVNSEGALRRAARRARELAQGSVGYVVIYRDGKIVEDKLDKHVA